MTFWAVFAVCVLAFLLANLVPSVPLTQAVPQRAAAE